MTPPSSGRIRIAMPWMMPSDAMVATIAVDLQTLDEQRC